MKKLTIFAAVVSAVVTMSSCSGQGGHANMKTDIDTLSYAFGMMQTQGLEDYLSERLGIDSTYMADFVEGLKSGANAGDNKKKAAYYAGLQIGQQIAQQMVPGINREIFGEDSTQTISMNNLLAGFITAATHKKGHMTMEQAIATVQSKMAEIRSRELEKQYGQNRLAGERWLAENAKKEGVVTLESGVQYKIIKEGNGKVAADTSLVKVNYEGKLLDGTVFDSSYKRNQPADFRANQMIKGWTEVLTKMPAGSVWEVYIPQEMGYGEREMDLIKPFSALIFKIELLEVK